MASPELQEIHTKMIEKIRDMSSKLIEIYIVVAKERPISETIKYRDLIEAAHFTIDEIYSDMF